MSELSAVWALSKVGDAAIDPLMDKMDDPEKNVRESAIWGLSKIGAPALQALGEKMGSADWKRSDGRGR